MRRSVKYVYYLATHYKKIWITISAVIVAILLFLYFGIGVGEIVEFFRQSPFLVTVAILAIYCVLSVVWVIPKHAVYLSTAVVFPIGWAFVISYIGVTLTLIIGYLVGRNLSQERLLPFIEKSALAKRVLIKHGGIKPPMAMIFRFLPLPMGLINIFFGASGLKFLPYAAYSLIGLTPVMIIVILIANRIPT